MSSAQLDPVIHAPLRLHLMAMLAVVDQLEFARAREQLGVSDSVLSKHLSTLAEAGYVKVSKPLVGSRRVTRMAMTREGRTAYDAHVTALRELIDTTAPADEPA